MEEEKILHYLFAQGGSTRELAYSFRAFLPKKAKLKRQHILCLVCAT